MGRRIRRLTANELLSYRFATGRAKLGLLGSIWLAGIYSTIWPVIVALSAEWTTRFGGAGLGGNIAQHAWNATETDES